MKDDDIERTQKGPQPACVFDDLPVIGSYAELRVHRVKTAQRAFASYFRPEIGDRPPVLRLENRHVVSELAEILQQAAQKVRISVVPVGPDGMREISDAKFMLHIFQRLLKEAIEIARGRPQPCARR